jgi:hypothetical protein
MIQYNKIIRFFFSKQMAKNPARGNPNQEGTSVPAGNIRRDRYLKLTLNFNLLAFNLF